MGLRLHVRSGWTTSQSKNERATFEVEGPRIVVGRAASADLPLPHPAVSTRHALLEHRGTGWVAIDEGSTNGTAVNGEAIPPGRPKAVRTGDVLEIGGFRIELEVAVVAAATNADKTSALARRLLRDALGGDRLAAPKLRVLNGETAGEELELPEAPSSVVLGRGDDCDLALPDGDCSREHCEVLRDPDGVVVRDLESKNRTFVNDRRVERERWLRDRDELRIGATVLAFEDPAEDAMSEVLAEAVVPLAELPVPSFEEPEPEPEDEPDAGVVESEELHEPSAEVETEPPPPIAVEPPRKPRRGARTDVIIYVVAGAVLALSVAGLIWLTQAGG